MSRRSGTLRLQSLQRTADIVFSKGEVVAVHVLQGTSSVGERLLEVNAISPTRYQALLGAAKTKPAGPVLFAEVDLTTEDLVEPLKQYLTDLICDLFDWSEGTFSFVLQENVNPWEGFSLKHACSVFPDGVSAQFLATEGARLQSERASNDSLESFLSRDREQSRKPPPDEPPSPTAQKFAAQLGSPEEQAAAEASASSKPQDAAPPPQNSAPPPAATGSSVPSPPATSSVPPPPAASSVPPPPAASSVPPPPAASSVPPPPATSSVPAPPAAASAPARVPPPLPSQGSSQSGWVPGPSPTKTAPPPPAPTTKPEDKVIPFPSDRVRRDEAPEEELETLDAAELIEDAEPETPAAPPSAPAAQEPPLKEEAPAAKEPAATSAPSATPTAPSVELREVALLVVAKSRPIAERLRAGLASSFAVVQVASSRLEAEGWLKATAMIPAPRMVFADLGVGSGTDLAPGLMLTRYVVEEYPKVRVVLYRDADTNIPSEPEAACVSRWAELPAGVVVGDGAAVQAFCDDMISVFRGALAEEPNREMPPDEDPSPADMEPPAEEATPAAVPPPPGPASKEPPAEVPPPPEPTAEKDVEPEKPMVASSLPPVPAPPAVMEEEETNTKPPDGPAPDYRSGDPESGRLFDLAREIASDMTDLDWSGESRIPSQGDPRMETLRSLMAELIDPANRDAIALLVLRFAAQILERGALFLVARRAFVGQGGFSPDLDSDEFVKRVRSLRVPAGQDSIMDVVARLRTTREGALEDTPGNRNLQKGLGGAWHDHPVIVIPLLTGGRVAAVLYGDNPTGEPLGPVDALDIFMQQAGQTMDRALLERQLRVKRDRG